jgi:DNA-binding transcriptional LysR family regulator
LKIAAIPYFARKFLMPALQDLKLHDQSNVFHVRGGAAEKAVKHGEVDVAFFSAKARPKRSTRLCIEIRKETVGIVGLKSKFQKLEDIKSLAELDDMPWVIGDRPRDDWFSSLDGKLGCFWVDDHFSARSLVLEGHAIALFQLDYFTEMEISKLAVSKIKIPSEGLKLYCVIASGLEVEKMRKIKLLISKVKKMASI